MHAKKTYGFTLVELLVTLSIIIVVLTLGVPSFNSTIRDSRMAGHSNRFLGSLNMARSEAIKRGQRVFLCKADVEAATPVCNGDPCNGGANCWEKGWIVVADTNDPPNGFPDAEDTLIRAFEGLPKALTLRPNTSAIANWIAFDSVGEGHGGNGTVNGRFNLCQGSDIAHSRAIILNSLGRAKIQKGGATACP